MEITEFLRVIVEKEASDGHIKAGSSPVVRTPNGGLEILHGFPVFSAEDTERIAYSIMRPLQKEQFEKTSELDISYACDSIGRFRINIYRQKGNVGLAIRRTRAIIPSYTELNLPAQMRQIALSERGIVLLAGITGSGKSTTLACMIENINKEKARHIITIEDPIEFVFEDKKSIINQREIDIDTASFHSALKHAVRQDPDVIAIGEIRDPETFQASISASETGHLVFSTIHSTDCTQAISRILEFFLPPRQPQIRLQLSYHIRAIICQRLLKKADGRGLIPAVEMLIGTPTVSHLIRENKIEKIYSAIQTGIADGMQTLNQSLVKLVQAKLVTLEEALIQSENPDGLKMNLKGIYLDEERKIIG